MGEDLFKKIYSEHIKRAGADACMNWLSRSDFFCAPASTMFHGNYAGGLCQHSINAFEALCADPRSEGYPMESKAIVALLHDVCKANFYEPWWRNVKDESTGQWKKVQSYRIADAFPYGHGEKSVFIIQSFMSLSAEEAMAIRWHMGAYTDGANQQALNAAFEKYPLAQLLHFADDWAAKRMDKKVEP